MIIDRYMGIYSTATGYDIHVIKTGETKRGLAGRVRFARIYKNVSTATMGRFYWLSESYMTIEAPKAVTYSQYYNIFPD